MSTSADGPGDLGGARRGDGSAGDATGGAGALTDDERAELLALRGRYPPRHRLRSFFSALLITLAAVLAPLSAVAVWAADEMGDTDRYVSTVAPLADDPHVRAAVTARVTDAVMEHVDIDALLSGVAPDDRPEVKTALGALSGPITGGLKDFVHDTVARVVSSDAFAAIWTQLNRQAHGAVTGALTGDDDSAVQARDNEVVLDLAPVVDQVKQQLVDRGLGVASKIPEIHTEFTLLKSDDVGRVRTGFRLLQLAGNWLPPVTLVLAAAGVLLAVRRRRALVAAALGLAAGVAVLGVGLAVFRVVYLNQLPTTVDDGAAGAIYDQVVRVLRTSVRMIVVLGVVVALGAWLSGAGRWAVRVRTMWESGIAAVRGAAGVTSTGPVGPWVHRFRTWLRWGAVLVAAVVLVLWPYPTGLVIFWIALVVVAALAVIEFLDDQGPGAGTGTEPGPRDASGDRRTVAPS